jgi:hypothetical protein
VMVVVPATFRDLVAKYTFAVRPKI